MTLVNLQLISFHYMLCITNFLFSGPQNSALELPFFLSYFLGSIMPTLSFSVRLEVQDSDTVIENQKAKDATRDSTRDHQAGVIFKGRG